MTSLEGRDLVVVRGGRRILDGASIRVGPGEAVAIQGPSGSGKSTLIRVLSTLLEMDEGSLLLDGRDGPVTRLRQIGDECLQFPVVADRDGQVDVSVVRTSPNLNDALWR